MSTNYSFNHRNLWTTQQFLSLSKNLEQAYGCQLKNSPSACETNFWTTDKLISMSKCLSSAYGVDFQ